MNVIRTANLKISLILLDASQNEKVTFEALILVGAFDAFGKTRSTLLQAIDQVLDGDLNIEQDGFLFDILTPKQMYEDKEELPDALISQYEKEYLGFYVSQHPVDKMFVAKQYLTIFKLSNAQNNKPILVQFDKVKQIRTKMVKIWHSSH